MRTDFSTGLYVYSCGFDCTPTTLAFGRTKGPKSAWSKRTQPAVVPSLG